MAGIILDTRLLGGQKRERDKESNEKKNAHFIVLVKKKKTVYFH